MAVEWSMITHITKIDPAKPLPADLGVLKRTDMVIVGGSDNVTADNTLATIQQVADVVPDIPLLQEPYVAQHVSTETVAAVDQLFVPSIYNGDDTHFRGKQLEIFTELGSELEGLWEQDGTAADIATKISAVGYVIQNTTSKAAAVAGVSEAFSKKQVRGAALATEIFYDFPLFYIENSGQFGNMDDIHAAASVLDETQLLYGGGIDSAQKATKALTAGADAVVVGDCFHEDPNAFVQTIDTDSQR